MTAVAQGSVTATAERVTTVFAYAVLVFPLERFLAGSDALASTPRTPSNELRPSATNNKKIMKTRLFIEKERRSD